MSAFTAELMRARLLGDVEGMLAEYKAALDHRLPIFSGAPASSSTGPSGLFAPIGDFFR